MSQTERLYRIVRMLEDRRQGVSLQQFLDELEISRATFKRDLEYLRDRLGAPVRWQRAEDGRPGGYVLDGPADARDGYGIRGLWFNPSEIHALLMMRQLAAGMEPGLLAEQTASLMTRLGLMLGSADDEPAEVARRVRILHSASRRSGVPCFETVAHATLKRRRLRLSYYARSRESESERIVSPQQLLHYRENWYLHAWCHAAGALRTFALDAIRSAETSPEAAHEVPSQALEQAIGPAFGIFSSQQTEAAVLRFEAHAANWAASQNWHPQQRQIREADGRLRLEIPFGNPTELVMELLRFGPDVEVLAPPALRDAVATRLRAAAERYD